MASELQVCRGTFVRQKGSLIFHVLSKQPGVHQASSNSQHLSKSGMRVREATQPPYKLPATLSGWPSINMAKSSMDLLDISKLNKSDAA